MDRFSARNHIQFTCGAGWLNLVDVLFDNKPDSIVITEVFQKWGGLKISFEGNDEHFMELAQTVYEISTHLCEICGNSARLRIMDGWETALCDQHYLDSDAKEKYAG